MIPVTYQKGPPALVNSIATQGKAFLQTKLGQKISGKEWNANSYWQEATDELHQLYRGFCAYSAEWIPKEKGLGRSVDHFIPKSVRPELAYEWSNFRLCFDRINSAKGEESGIFDPFLIEDGWFAIDFPSLLVTVGNGCPAEKQPQAERTIKVLELDQEWVVNRKRKMIREVTALPPADQILHLRENAPFLYRELDRQGWLDRMSELISP